MFFLVHAANRPPWPGKAPLQPDADVDTIAYVLARCHLALGRGKRKVNMSGQVTIDVERCKGCGVCVSACPKDCIVMSKATNSKGYLFARSSNALCTGCALCAQMCPDVAIEVSRDSGQVIEALPSRPVLSRELL